MRPSGLFGGTKNHTMSMLLESWVNCFTGDGKYAIDPSPIDTTARACMHSIITVEVKVHQLYYGSARVKMSYEYLTRWHKLSLFRFVSQVNWVS